MNCKHDSKRSIYQINERILLFEILFVLKDDLNDNATGFEMLVDLGLQIFCVMWRGWTMNTRRLHIIFAAVLSFL
jgi:hypothetical protein